MRNPAIPVLAQNIRALGLEVFDDWFSPGPEADEYWQKYEKDRGRTYKESLAGYHAKTVFAFDHHHLSRASTVVLVMPAGRSAHLELGWAVGKGKKGFVLFDKEPERYDIMYQFATDIFFNEKDLLNVLSQEHPGRSDQADERPPATNLRATNYQLG